MRNLSKLFWPAFLALVMLAFVAGTARAYDCTDFLVDTSEPGGTMVAQGPRVAIERLHPEFRERLCSALLEAHLTNEELAHAGIFSAYRPPGLGVGGFKDKFDSCHAYGLAVDVTGIGRPGSAAAKAFHSIAARHGIVCPYGPDNQAEWNHCQFVRVKACGRNTELRKPINRDGPVTLASMFGVVDGLNRHLTEVAYAGGKKIRSHNRRGAKILGNRGHRSGKNFASTKKGRIAVVQKHQGLRKGIASRPHRGRPT